MDTDKKSCLYPCCNEDATTQLQLCNEHGYHADYRSFRDQLRQKRDQPKGQSEAQQLTEAIFEKLGTPGTEPLPTKDTKGLVGTGTYELISTEYNGGKILEVDEYGNLAIRANYMPQPVEPTPVHSPDIASIAANMLETKRLLMQLCNKLGFEIPPELQQYGQPRDKDALDKGLTKLLEGAGIPVEAEGTAVAVLRQAEAEQKRVDTILSETARAEILKQAKDCSKGIMLVPSRYMVFDEAGNHVGWSTDEVPVSGPPERAGRVEDLGQALLALKHSGDILEQARRLREIGNRLIDYAQELTQAYNTRTMS